MVGHLLCKHEALSSNSSPIREKKRERDRDRQRQREGDRETLQNIWFNDNA
jgi:hypothetical protein